MHRQHDLINVIQALSVARDLDGIVAVLRGAARRLTGADGITVVLRDGENCHYAEEDAIGPLWKGRRFPLKTCISGWCMLNAQPAVIDDGAPGTTPRSHRRRSPRRFSHCKRTSRPQE